MDSTMIVFIILMVVITIAACICGYMAEKKEKEAWDNFINAGAGLAILLVRFFESSKSVSNNPTKESTQSVFTQDSLTAKNSNRNNNSQQNE